MSTMTTTADPPEGGALRWFRRLMWAGIIANVVVGIVSIAYTPQVLALAKVDPATPLVWPRLSAMLVMLLAGFYVPAAIDPGIFVGAKTVAATMIDLLTRPDVLARATDEFRQRTGGGIGGDKWVAPLLPKDFAPPIDLRWPEYIQTVRGEEWWLPTPAVGSGAGERLHDGGTRD